MTILRVGSLCRYLTESEGLTWRGADFDARNIVKAVKGSAFGGYSNFKVGGVWKKFDNSNAEELVPVILGHVGQRLLNHAVDRDFVVVPIPNSGMAQGVGGPFRIVELAKMLCDAAPRCLAVTPALRWAQVRTASHQVSGRRSPDQYEPHLRYVEQVSGPVVLFDDVITSGSQMIAAARVLRGQGVNVVMGVTVGNTVKDQRENTIEWVMNEFELDPPAFDLDAFLREPF
ncbi:phosphoribosyltransferase [Aureimonas leprariae]|uniref:Phosphoribosyltransferase n=1 Tax=Plantimonas leprariae TaxID=2615207 RepID=A0A7V7TY52_9HYPH|nr:phosphoribosyltransferase [Aureimonas leprariae]KAB0682000.1 phosphoribosyltransferase [Aureimonas leprariae]